MRRARHISDAEARDVEHENTISGDIGCEVGFCHDCERRVDEPAGRLHKSTCKSVEQHRKEVA